MSAIGSVIVMAVRPSLHRGFAPEPQERPAAIVCRRRGWGSPGALGHAGQLAPVGHLPQADPAQAELAVDGLGTATALAACVAAHLELRLASRLDLQAGLRHVSSP